MSKATVSQLEAGSGNPSVETLWAIATTLGVPFSVLVEEPERPAHLIRAAEHSGIRASGSAYEALLLAAGSASAPTCTSSGPTPALPARLHPIPPGRPSTS
ncbi:MAG: helix-turn-helix transcriptional regulator [Microbacterium sp.]